MNHTMSTHPYPAVRDVAAPVDDRTDDVDDAIHLAGHDHLPERRRGFMSDIGHDLVERLWQKLIVGGIAAILSPLIGAKAILWAFGVYLVLNLVRLWWARQTQRQPGMVDIRLDRAGVTQTRLAVPGTTNGFAELPMVIPWSQARLLGLFPAGPDRHRLIIAPIGTPADADPFTCRRLIDATVLCPGERRDEIIAQVEQWCCQPIPLIDDDMRSPLEQEALRYARRAATFTRVLAIFLIVFGTLTAIAMGEELPAAARLPVGMLILLFHVVPAIALLMLAHHARRLRAWAVTALLVVGCLLAALFVYIIGMAATFDVEEDIGLFIPASALFLMILLTLDCARARTLLARRRREQLQIR